MSRIVANIEPPRMTRGSKLWSLPLSANLILGLRACLSEHGNRPACTTPEAINLNAKGDTAMEVDYFVLPKGFANSPKYRELPALTKMTYAHLLVLSEMGAHIITFKPEAGAKTFGVSLFSARTALYRLRDAGLITQTAPEEKYTFLVRVLEG